MIDIGLRMGSISVLATLVVLQSGCGRTDRQQTALVHGIVTLDGKPLEMGEVIFAPENGRAATGTIRMDGSFELGTYKKDDGAILGTHKVAVEAREQLEGESPGAPLISRLGRSLIPEHYSDQETSKLRYEVTEDGNEFHIQLFKNPATSEY